MAISKKEAKLRKHLKEILIALGYSTADPNIKDTPKRVARLWCQELSFPPKLSRKLFSTFPSDIRQMITLKEHQGWSRCPHHLERVELVTSVAYIPSGKVLGLSKLARIADYFSQGLVLQEDYTETFADGLFESLKPLGVAVMVKGVHLCMKARGVESTGLTITTALRGVFQEEGVKGLAAREEFLSLVK